MIELGQVVAVYPGRREVDVVLSNSGARMTRLKVVSGSLGTDHGSWATPAVPRPTSETQAGGIAPNGQRTIIAVVAMAFGRGIVLGFLPFGGAFATTEDNRDIHRHPSGAYVTVAPDGSIEAFHPSGAHFRIGTGGHAGVPGVPAAPAGAAVPQITLAAGGFSLTVTPDGRATMIAPGGVRLDTPAVHTTGSVMVGNGATGTFSTAAGLTVTVQDGIITNIN